MRNPRRMLAALALVATACTATPDAVSPPDAGPDLERLRRPFQAQSRPIAPAGLQTFDDCKQLLRHVRSKAASITTAWGLPGGFGLHGDVVMFRSAVGVAEAASAPAAAPAPQGAGGDGFSTTNVQEEGVDEPDSVKSDGKRILAVARGRLNYVVPAGDRPRIAGSMKLPDGGGYELLVAGDRALVMQRGGWYVEGDRAASPLPRSWQNRERTTILVVDVADPERMRTVATLHFDGSYTSARMIDGIARVVLRSSPRPIEFVAPKDGSPAEQRRAQRLNRDKVRRTPLDTWMPEYLLDDRRGPVRRVTGGAVTPCSKVHRPKEFSGVSMITVTTIDPHHPTPDKGVSVLGDAGIVYASPQRLYVATNRFDAFPIPLGAGPAVDAVAPARRQTIETEIHSFDIAGRGAARYLATGKVEGTVLNQFSLSEHRNVLRVATTVDAFDGKSESFVTTLVQRDNALVRIGRVGNLGKGERIYAVRYIGDLGYVVTFRQVDPLYVIDLSDARKLRVVGELKIPGFSAYLHPVGDGLLLGVGKEATEDGRVTGTQVSLFDVSDAAAPKQLFRHQLGQGHSDAEYDHHAFLWWAPRRLAMLPIQIYDVVAQEGSSRPSQPFAGVVGLQVEPEAGIDEIARLEHPSSKEFGLVGISRSLVIGDRVFTVSENGIASSALAALDDTRFAGWPAV